MSRPKRITIAGIFILTFNALSIITGLNAIELSILLWQNMPLHAAEGLFAFFISCIGVAAAWALLMNNEKGLIWLNGFILCRSTGTLMAIANDLFAPSADYVLILAFSVVGLGYPFSLYFFISRNPKVRSWYKNIH